MATITRITFAKVFLSLLIIIIVLNVYAETTPILATAGNDLNATGVPLGANFDENGVVLLIVMLSLALFIIIGLLRQGEK